MRRALALAFAAVAALAARGVAQTPAPLAFEVASIKANQSLMPGRTGVQIGAERFDAGWYPVLGLVTLAHGFDSWRTP